MSPVSAATTTAGGADVVSLVSYLEEDNKRLRQTVAELSRQISALRQELERLESDKKG